MTWLVWALVVLAAAALAWWFRRTPWRAGKKPDPMEGHYAARRRERAAALTEWERDFRRAQGLPEVIAKRSGLGDIDSVWSEPRMSTRSPRMLCESHVRLAWLPTLSELNPARDVECVVDRIEDPPLCSAPHSAPLVPRPKPARAITVIQA